jgi:hypothetical protein
VFDSTLRVGRSALLESGASEHPAHIVCRLSRMRRRGFGLSFLVAVPLLAATVASGQAALAGEPIQIGRLTSPVTIDGDLSDEAWQHATRIDRWYETQPGDNTEPKVKNVGYLAYDDHYFYAAFEFEDPNPSAMRAPFADRDDIGNGFNDYGGILLDPRNTGSTGFFFVVTPRNIQYDSTFSGTRRRALSLADGRWSCAFRSRPYGIGISTRRPGAFCCIAITLAISITSSTRPGCRATGIASCAAPTC